VFFTNGPEDGSGFNTLLHNEGGGVFTDTSDFGGVAGDPSGKGSCVLDANVDGWPDIFVATGREFGNHLFINQGDGTFRDEALEWGVSDPFQRFGIGPSCGDFDNDGDPDIFLVTHDKWWAGNAYFVNQGDHFVDMAEEAGVADNYLDGHGNAWVDVDLDGWLDLVLSGIGTPPYILINQRDNTFGELCFASGGVTQANSLTWAVVPGDLTGDGYPELYITNGLGRRPAENRLFRARGELGNHYLTVQVVGVTHNPSQLGAMVELTTDETTQTRWVGTWTSFDSQGPLPVTFGLGSETEVEQLVVTFTNGEQVVLGNIPADQTIVVTEPVDWEDADHDGVQDEWDVCPDTRSKRRTDGEGCAPEQRGGVAIGLTEPLIASVVAEPPVFTWQDVGARSAVVELSVDGTFGPAGLFTFGPTDGALYATTAEQWDAVLAEVDGTKPVIWRVVAVGDQGEVGYSDARSFYPAVHKDQLFVPEGSNRFVPAHVVVDPGTKVVITNDAVEAGNLQNEPHDVQLLGPDGRILSEKIDLTGAGVFEWTFTDPGRYNFICHRHAGVGHHGDVMFETDVHSHGHVTNPFHCMAGTVTVR
jgi:plastocyanin